MTHLIKPKTANVIDALTGANMPLDGITRDVLLPQDHYLERVGDVTIIEAAQPPKANEKKPSDKGAKPE
jgi:hypothetical protein